MLENYQRNLFNAHGLKSLFKSPVMPAQNLAIAGDDEMASVGLRIFCDQRQPIPGPVIDKVTNMSYEKVAEKGKGDYVTIDNFVTDDFDIGDPVIY